MKEKLYTIPVTNAFNSNCECPLCNMKETLETNAIEYTVGPSYMEDDIRATTDEMGFCQKHITMLYEQQNRLGLAMILKTHLDYTNKTIAKLAHREPKASSSLFKKKIQESEISSYINNLDNTCFICQRIDTTFNRYITTIFHLYKHESEFKKIFLNSKGLCTTHYGMLYDQAGAYYSGDSLKDFTLELNKLYLDNMKRVKDELEWFIDKFDYRNTDEPWRNSKDALIRTLQKTNGVFLQDE